MIMYIPISGLHFEHRRRLFQEKSPCVIRCAARINTWCTLVPHICKWSSWRGVLNICCSLCWRHEVLPVNQKHGAWWLPTARPRPHFNQWCDLWEMNLNQSKCGLLSITRNASPFHFPYKLSDVKVKTMEAQKDLGDLVTKHLKWNSQVLAAYSKANSLAFSGDQLATLMTSELASYFTCH